MYTRQILLQNVNIKQILHFWQGDFALCEHNDLFQLVPNEKTDSFSVIAQKRSKLIK